MKLTNEINEKSLFFYVTSQNVSGSVFIQFSQCELSSNSYFKITLIKTTVSIKRSLVHNMWKDLLVFIFVAFFFRFFKSKPRLEMCWLNFQSHSF